MTQETSPSVEESVSAEKEIEELIEDKIERDAEDGELYKEVTVDFRGLLIRTLIAFAALVVALLLVGIWIREPLMKFSAGFVKAVGGPGIAVGWLLIDGVAFPFPNDVLSFFGIQGGMSFWSVIAWSTGGSLAGGAVGFWIGWGVGF